MKYFKVIFDNDNDDLYIKADSTNKIILWILKNRPMSDFYGVNIVEVWPDKSIKDHGNFEAVAIADAWYYELNTTDDEVVRKAQIFLRSEPDATKLTKEYIAEKLETNDKWLYQGITAIYNRQTADEQAAGETTHQNGVGFNGVDAQIMSSFAEFLAKTGFLTSKQKIIARKKMKKYAGQLLMLAQA